MHSLLIGSGDACEYALNPQGLAKDVANRNESQTQDTSPQEPIAVISFDFARSMLVAIPLVHGAEQSPVEGRK
jgi:hypothetical protein